MEQIAPAALAALGLSVCLCGGRFTRLYCFILGFLIGTSFTFWFFDNQIEVRHAGIPLIVGLLVSLVSGVVCLLLHLVTLAGILGWTAASLLIVIDNGNVLVYYRTWLYLIALAAALWVTYTRPLQAARLTTAASGALILVLGVDSYAHRSFGALIFQDTFLEYPLGLESAAARCFTWRCWMLLPLWVGLGVLGYANQFYTEQLSQYEQSWPLLFQKRIPSNYSVTRRLGRSPPEAAAENLVAEDRNYAVSNYNSYNSFLKIQSKQQAAAQQQAQQAAASAALHTRIQPASQELGSAHADDKQVLPPAQRASFNFIELTKLPPTQHYLYLLIHQAFTDLAASFGFQADNVNNQYEHLLFLIGNYQSAEKVPLGTGASGTNAATTSTEGGYQAGAYAAAAAAAAAAAPLSTGPNNDAISQLHTRLFSNYREWIKYMNLGGNNTLGGSAISSDVVPLVRSQIADMRVDKNTTDAKIEEICLWLLVWGEGGSLRHTPECLIYLFHNLSCENRRAHARFGGGQLNFEDAGGPASTVPSANMRPRRAPGDFLHQVVKPLYDVMVLENARPLGVGRNYDDLNEFFWRTEALQYYFADVKYRAADPGPPPPRNTAAGGGGMCDLEDPPSRRSSTSIAQALRVSPLKSFLEKRSWLHPLRSFMRLISFYGVCFHILVCIAYIHYAHLPLLGEASNKILSSFVLSLASYSLLKEVLELWATYGIISDSVWNGIGFLMRSAIKLAALLAMGVCYVWSWGNAQTDPALAAQYWNAYLFLALIYLAPQALTILTQLFPTLGAKLTNLRLPFADELIKFWYPLAKSYVARDIHEPEHLTYRYQLFWCGLLIWKMYMSLLFQISPLIAPTMDILDHIATLSVSIHTYQRWLCYLQIVVLWLPFVLVYLFDTIIWYFLWQAIVGLIVGMNVHLGEIRAFPQLVKVFTQLPKEFDRKIVFNANKRRGAAAAAAAAATPSKVRSASNSPSLAPLHPRTGEQASLLAMGAGGHLVPNVAGGPGMTPRAPPAGDASSNLAQPLTMSRARRNSLGGGAPAAVTPDPFRNVAWENFAVVWNEVIEDLRTGDLISNQERHMLRFRFDTTSTKEYYLPLFLMVGRIDESIDRCVESQNAWSARMKSSAAGGGLDSGEKAGMETDLIHFLLEDNPLRRECLAEVWEHVQWLLSHLLGERHVASLNLTFGKIAELLLGHRHVLRGTNLAALNKVKSDLLNLVRGLRIASASYATFRLAEAAKKNAAERAAEEEEEARREEEKRAQEEREAEDAELSQQDDEDGAVHSDEEDESEDPHAARRHDPLRAQRKRLIQDAERKTQQRGSLARAREFNLQGLLKASPSFGTLDMLEKLKSRPRHRSAAFVPRGINLGSSTNLASAGAESDSTGYLILHISLIRDQLSALLSSIAACFNAKYNAELERDSNFHRTTATQANPNVATDIIGAIKHTQISNEGFMWDGAYAGAQIHALLADPHTNIVLATMHSLLTVAAIDVEPKSVEANRRLLYFANSLFMALPVAPSVRSMKSLSTLTPFHSEDIIYSYSDLEKKTEDGVSVFFYLQTIYPMEWANFLQRCGIPEDSFNTARGSNILSADKKHNLEARLWATMRGQTLGRTVDGMMLYEKALRLLLKLEEPESPAKASQARTEIDDHTLLVQSKYTYIISCQVYGKQKRENDPKAADIEFLLARYPSVRVAYIDSVKVPFVDPIKSPGQTLVKEEFYSVLIKSERHPVTGANEIKEVYRIQLPGNPVLGEGKPENQNHALVFTRGEYLQTIDMNQSNYFEEALKMRNLLEEFNSKPGAGEKKTAIVGFREHIYTGGLSSIANFMALQEGTFVTQGQRVLDNPLRVRFHYGHPDVFDKLFFMSRGGVSKASRGINLSEDIFAGFNSVLRGGSIKFREYIQVGKGRDVGLQQLFKFEAKLAQGNSMQSISRDIYRIANSVDFFRLCSFFFGGVGFYITNCITIWALYLFIYSRLILAGYRLESLDSFSGADTISYWFGMIGFLLTLPVFATIGLERGFGRGIIDVLRMVVTGGPLFFMFHMGTKSYYFEQTMLAGGARYRPTGRGFVTRHEHFSEIFRFHAGSHFYRSVEMLIALLLYAIVIPPTYSYSLVTWAGWLIVAAWLFGPFWFNPLAFEWEKTVVDWMDFSEWMARREGDGDRSWRAWWKDETSFLLTLPFSTRASLAVFQIRYVIVGLSLLYFVGATKQQVAIAAAILASVLTLVVFVRARIALEHQLAVRLSKVVLVIAVLLGIGWLVEVYTLSTFEAWQYCLALVALTYLCHAGCNMALMLGMRNAYLLRWFKLVDWAIAGGLFCVLGLLSVTLIPSMIQTRLMFHNAFSRGVLIDKLLRTKPDEDGSGSGGGKDSGASKKHPAPSPTGRRRKDASRPNGADDDQQPEDSPDSAHSEHGGFDLQAISFIERRSAVPKKKLHPSKGGETEPLLGSSGGSGGNGGGFNGGATGGERVGGMVRSGSSGGGKQHKVSFGGASSSSGSSSSLSSSNSQGSLGFPPRKTPSVVDLSIQEESESYSPSPHMGAAIGPLTAIPGSPAMHLPVSALAGRPIPSSSAYSPKGYSPNAGGAGPFAATQPGLGGSPQLPNSHLIKGSILAAMAGRSTSDGTGLTTPPPPGPSAAGLAFPPSSRQGSAGTLGSMSSTSSASLVVPHSPSLGFTTAGSSSAGSSSLPLSGLHASLSSHSMHSSSSNSPRTGTSSPAAAPSSPSIGPGVAGGSRLGRADKLGGLPPAGATKPDERPIPKTTILPHELALATNAAGGAGAAGMPNAAAMQVAKSPLNPRRA